MRHHRRRIVTAVLTMLLTTGSWLAMQAARPERAPNLVRMPDWQPQTWYPLDDHGSVANCELPASHRYRIVLGCLGDATQEHRVSVRLAESSSELSGDEHHSTTNKFSDWHVAPRTDPTVIDAPPSPHHASPKLPLVAPRDFFLHVTDGELDDLKQYARIPAINAASGNRVRVFVDPQLAKGEIPQTRIDELVRLLESDVLPRVESQFGSLCDVDGDGCLAVLLTPWLSRLQGGRTSISGMVRSSDFQRNLSPPFSNRCDMLFLNSSFPSDAALRDLLSHEVAHAACISQRLSRGTGTLRDEDDWLSEALAHLAEPGWSNLDHRLVAFLDDPSRYPLVVPDYYRAGLWRNPGCRGATFLFTRWCVGREPNLLRQLAQSLERGTRNLERATGRRFEELFRMWSLSLANGNELDSADLKSALQRLGSAGLRPTVIDKNFDEVTLPIRGTAFAVVDLLVDESSSRTLRIVGDSSAKWQFSVCQCPEDSRGRSEDSALATVRR